MRETGHLLLEDEDEDESSTAMALLASRARLLVAVFVPLLLLVVVRLTNWQLLSGAIESAPVVSAQTHDIGRGRIVDRNGLLMATDDYVGEVYYRPAEIQTSSIGPSLMVTLTNIFQLPEGALQATQANTGTLASLTKSASVAQCDQVRQLQIAHLVWCDIKNKRTYPQGSLAAHVVGFTNYENKGIYGVEARYNDWLGSLDDALAHHLGNAPEELPESWRIYLPSPAGQDIVLNIDAPLQYVLESHLTEAIEYYGAESGSIIAMDPRNGALLALANWPSFDLNGYSQHEPSAWTNPAISDLYEPGSVLKVVTMAAGIDSGDITPGTRFMDEGSLLVAGRVIRNAQNNVYGDVDVTEALVRSINVVSAQVSMRMGADKFYSYIRRFGFGSVTEVDLSAEASGIVKKPGNPEWSMADLATNSYGQGISVTGLQMINAVAAIANHGMMMQPQAVRALVQDGLIYRVPVHQAGQVVKPETAQKLTDMMITTVESSSIPDPVPGYRVAGKTGTADIPTETGYSSEDTITSFIGFLPAGDPQLILMVKLSRPQRSVWAEAVAVPVFAAAAQDAVRILHIKPDHPISQSSDDQ